MMKNIALVPCILLYAVATGKGQCEVSCDSLKQARGDSWYYTSVLNDSTLDTAHAQPSSTFAPGYRYEYQSDSIHVYWYFSEFNVNRHKLFLSNWCAPRIINYDQTSKNLVQTWTPLEMNNRSTTRMFPMTSGDTIGFYRELWVRRFGVALPVYDYYKCSEVLSYNVELVDSATGSRLALLDSTRFDTTRTSRKPCVTSWYPMYSRVYYVVPDGYYHTPVFIRINTYVEGNNPDIMIRVDEHGQMRSTRFLANPRVQEYCSQFQVNLDCSVADCGVTVTTNQSPPSLTITNTSVPTTCTLTVYSVSGVMVWSGVLTQVTNPFTVAVPTPGLYVVVVRNDASVVCARKVVVQ